MPEIALELPSNGRFGDALDYPSSDPVRTTAQGRSHLAGQSSLAASGVSEGLQREGCDVQMAPQRTTQRRRWWILGLAVLAVVLVVGASGSWVLWRHFHQGQRMSIPGTVGSPFVPGPTPAPSTRKRDRKGRRS